MRLAAVDGAWFTARSLGICVRQTGRERCGLPGGAAGRRLEVLFQPLILAAQAVAFNLRATQVIFEPFNAPRLMLDDLLGVTRRLVISAPRHAPVMLDSDAEYNCEVRSGSADPQNEYLQRTVNLLGLRGAPIEAADDPWG